MLDEKIAAVLQVEGLRVSRDAECHWFGERY